MTGWLPEPEKHPLWPDLWALVATVRRRGFEPSWNDGDLLWLTSDCGEVIGVATTRLLANGDAELMHVAGTRLKEWAGLLEALVCDWARLNGAARITASGRMGWRRIVEPLGWKSSGDQYEKEL